MALTARLRDSLGIEAQSIWSDDGIALHLPDADAPPPLDELMLAPDELEELVVQEVGQTALFGARFRENASRALLIPRRRPGQRTPLWQQRLKAQNLLQVARKYGSFPIVLETYRECLQDVFDLPALKRILQGMQTRTLDVVEVETNSASPFASSLLFDYVATYMYEDDTPPAERRAQALSLDRDLLRELLGQEELRELIDADALAEVELQLRGAPRNADELDDQLRRRGHLFDGEYDGGFAETLLRERRALRVRLAGAGALISAQDAGRYRDALGTMPPGGLPEAFLEGGVDSLRQLVLRFAKGRGPFTTAEADARFGLELEPLLHELERADLLVRGELRPGGSEREWCDPDVLRRLRRASLAALRKGDRAGRAGRVRPLPPGLARDRPAREPARGARAAAGARAARLALGVRGAPAAGAELSAGLARRAVRLGRAHLGRRRPRSGGRLLPRGCAGAGEAGRSGGAGGRSGCRDPARRSGRAPSSGSRSWRPPGSSLTRRCPRSGSSSGPAR